MQNETGSNERRLLRLNQLYALLHGTSGAIAQARTREQLFAAACRLAVETGGARAAWISAQEEDERFARGLAQAGALGDYLEEARISVELTPAGRGPYGTALRERRTVVCDDTQTDPAFAPWRDLARRYGFGSVAVLPLGRGDRPWGAFVHYYGEAPGSFDAEQIELLEQLGGDLARAVEAIDEDQRRRASEQALRESEERFRTLFEAAGEGICLVGADDRFLRVNRRFCEILGYTERELLEGRNCVDTTHPDDRADDAAAVARLVAGEARVSLRKRYVRKDGRPVWAQLTLSLLRTAEGAPATFIGVIEDITQRLQAEEERDRLFNLSADLLLVADFDGRILQVNPAWTRGLGWTQEELVGRPWLALVHPDDRPTALRPESLPLGVPTSGFESRLLCKDGSYRWLAWHVHPLAEVRQLFAVGRDVTERRSAEERLRLLELCVSRLNDIVLITKADPLRGPGPEIVYVNDAFVRVTGFTAAEAIGSTPRILQGPRTERAVLDRLRGALERREHFHGELINYSKTLAEYWIELDVVPVNDERGRCTHFVAVERDVTERKRSEQRLAEQAALLDHARDAIHVRDLDNRVLYWNASAERLYGWRAQELVGRSILDVLYLDHEAFEEAMEILLRTGEWAGEFEQTTRDKQHLTVEAHWTLVRDEQGRPRSVLAISTDITQSKKLEAQFLRAQRMESIGALAGGIAHDLNNTLAPLLLTVSLLRQDERDPARSEDLATIEACAQRGADMVRELLLFARGTEGVRELTDLGGVATAFQKIVRDTFPKDIVFRCSQTEPLWQVNANQTQMHQLLANLCVNARDAMPHGGTLSLTLEHAVLDEAYAGMNVEARPGRYVVVRVEDTGTGMPPQVVDRIFEPFFTTKEIGKGTGLGLSTAHAIVRSHGGFIHVYSELNKGSRFKVYLPAVSSTEAAAEAAIEQPMLPRGNGELVLVVDDEEMIRDVASRALERYGYRVLLASNGAEAVSQYAQHRERIAVVLTDMSMPVMDGPATIVALRTMNPRVRIIGSSGLDANGHVAKAVGAGVAHFVPKPYTAEALLRVLQKILGE